MSKDYHTIEKKAALLLITGNLSIKEELINVADLAEYNDNKPKFENNTIHKSKDGFD